MTRRQPLVRKVATAATARSGRRQVRDQLRAQRAARRADELAQRRQHAARYRRLGGRRGQRRRRAARIPWDHRFETIELSTATLEALYPFQIATTGAVSRDVGMVIGPSVTGGTFAWDPWALYRAGRLTNPNVLILGDVGSGKSSLAKTLVWRGLEFGRGAHILDPKGEYAPLAEAAGCEPIALRPGGDVTLNPLDPGIAGADLSPSDLFHRNVATVRALLEATIGRACHQLELVLLSALLARVGGLTLDDPHRLRVTSHGDVPTLPMLADALVDPPADVARRVNIDPSRMVDESRDIALALARLVDDTGDLAGMFAGPTSFDPGQLGAMTVVDLAAIHRTHRIALPLVMICTAAWLQLATAVDPRGRFQVNDEAWALLSDEATARWMQTNQKLSRQLSLSVVNVMHRLSDTAAAGPAGSATRSLAEGVIADSGTCVIYRQKPAEQPLLRDTLQLNRLQAHLATRLPRGRGLWLVAGETRQIRLVDHTLSPTFERGLVDTDTAMHTADHPSDPDPAR